MSGRAGPRALGAALAVIAGCAAPDDASDAVDVRRIDTSVEVRRLERGAPLEIEVAAGDRVVLTATWADGALVIDAAATGPGVPITASVRAAPGAVLEIRNGLVVIGEAVYRLDTWQERNTVVASLAAPITRAFAVVAPYREAIVSRLAEAAPVFEAVALYQAWPDSNPPPWPALDDPRDRDPPGHLAGDVVGLGMTCSASIRCPDSAPYCITPGHGATFGVCTRACASDAACGDHALCDQPVIDIPDVSVPVLTCAIRCGSAACPGLLACAPDTATCEATQDHAR